MSGFRDRAVFIWSVADLPPTTSASPITARSSSPSVPRRLDCVLGPTQAAVLAELKKRGK